MVQLRIFQDQILAWCRPGDKKKSKTKKKYLNLWWPNLMPHVCVTGPQWVKKCWRSPIIVTCPKNVWIVWDASCIITTQLKLIWYRLIIWKQHVKCQKEYTLCMTCIFAPKCYDLYNVYIQILVADKYPFQICTNIVILHCPNPNKNVQFYILTFMVFSARAHLPSTLTRFSLFICLYCVP